jgi:hypothetical protein
MNDGSRTANPSVPAVRRRWCRLAALVLVVAAVGLPINHLFTYALLLIATVLIFRGEVVVRLGAWLAAILTVLIAVVLPLTLAPAPIEEGVNVFLPGGPENILERQLPPDVYQFMKMEFDALYPPAQSCAPTSPGCWVIGGYPDRAYAFSADSVFGKPAYSRSVTTIDFSDPVWLRLGFINDLRYNWYTDAPDVHRGDRDRRFWMGLRRWHIAMPWYVTYRLPADYVGSTLCWRGDVLWEGADQRYETLRHETIACRKLGPDDVGRKIFGVAIRPDTLAMTLHAPPAVEVRLMACAIARLLAVITVLVLLVRTRLRDVARPFVLIGLALVVIAIDDASFIGGWRPMDGGDDGLFYVGVARDILQQLLNGHIVTALAGAENVYYYGGPGLRYLLVPQMILFGDTILGYLSLILLMPIIVLALFKRFLSDEFAWRLALIFTVLPVGEIFGTSLFHYAKWAARGFADPAAHIFLLWGVLTIVGAREGPARKVATAAGGALLLALAVFTKPIVAPIVSIMLGGAGLAALAQRQWSRLAGMCIGFLPVLVMPLHNWYFGHEFVLFSRNARLPGTYVMSPSAYWSALVELMRLDFAGEHLRGAVVQIGDWLSGPGKLRAAIPLHAAAVAVVGYLTVRGREFDPWLRLIGGAVLAEYVVDLIYAATPRYFFEMWLLSALVVAVVIERRAPAWLQKHGWQSAKDVLDKSIGHWPAQAP